MELSGATAVTGLFVAPNSDGRLIARAAAGLFISKDFGDHWTAFAFPLPASDVNDIALPLTSLRLFSSAPALVCTPLPMVVLIGTQTLVVFPLPLSIQSYMVLTKRLMPWNMAGYMRRTIWY